MVLYSSLASKGQRGSLWSGRQIGRVHDIIIDGPLKPLLLSLFTLYLSLLYLHLRAQSPQFISISIVPKINLCSIRKHGSTYRHNLRSSSNPPLPLSITFLTRRRELRKLHAKNLLIQLIQYSMYGHIGKIAEAEKSGIEAAGGKADVYQCVPTPIPSTTTWAREHLTPSRCARERN